MKKRKLIIGVVVIVALALVIVVSNVLRRNAIVHDLQVQIIYGAYTAVPKTNAEQAPDADLSRTVDTLLTAPTLRQQVLGLDPTILSHKVKEVDRDYVASLAMKNPYVERADVSVNLWGDVVVKAVQRTPVVRIFTDKREYYLSHDTIEMPLSQEGEADVMVGTSERKNLRSLWELSCWLYDNPVYGDLFDQVSLAKNGDLTLVPKVGDHIVVVGSMENIDKKMSDLLAFYRKGLPQVGWNTYKQITLKYNGQIICQKR
ncbi:MAG: hypothetical protein HUK17_01475 [Bacteroidales bacterium]|nr:hypothetical protein [Bacteroidales bacterium]